MGREGGIYFRGPKNQASKRLHERLIMFAEESRNGKEHFSQWNAEMWHKRVLAFSDVFNFLYH